MKYSSLLEIIYSDNESGIDEIIKQAVNSEFYNQNEEVSQVIHTGVLFHDEEDDEKWELFYDLKAERIILQLKYMHFFPLLNGLLIFKDDPNFYHVYNYMKCSILNKIQVNTNIGGTFYDIAEDFIEFYSTELTELPVIDKTSDSRIIINSFLVISETSAKHFPLNRIIKKSINWNGYSFDIISDENPMDENIDDEFLDDSEEYSHESVSKYSGTWVHDVEGLSDDFIDDALGGEPDAYWNID